MSGTLVQRLDRLARHLVPFALAVVLVLVSAIPIYVPGYGPVAPDLVLMAVFYWAVHRPDLLSPAAVFAIGLLQDILVGMPPGMNALVLVLVRTVVVTQGRVFRGKSFLVMWWGFAMIAAGAAALIWILTAAFDLVLIDPLPIVFQSALTVALFPFLAWLLARIQHAVLSAG